MSDVYDGEVATLVVPGAATVEPGDVTDAEFLDHETRIQTIEAGHALAEHTDTSATAPSDGDTWVYNGTSGEWEPGAVSGALDTVGDQVPTVRNDVGWLTFGNGLIIDTVIAEPRTHIRPDYGGTGIANNPARRDHWHTMPTDTYGTWTAKGTVSSGTRSLTSVNVTLTAGIKYRVRARLRTQQRGTGGASYYRLRTIIAGTSRTTPASEVWCVGGVPDPRTFQQTREIDGTGAAITVSAELEYQMGDPLNVDAGELIVELDPRS